MPSEQDLKQLQSLPLEQKIIITQTRLLEFYQKERPYFSYSGGKDSAVLWHIIKRMERAGVIGKIPVIYFNIFYELPSVRAKMKSLEKAGELRTITGQETPKQVIERYGYPVITKQVAEQIYTIRNTKSQKQRNKMLFGVQGEKVFFHGLPDKYKPLLEAPFKIAPHCCHCLKKKPALQYERKEKRARITAITAGESLARRREWLHHGCNVFGAHAHSAPMAFWTEQDVLRYVKEFRVEIPAEYGSIIDKNGILETTGLKRTGCSFCLFGAHYPDDNRFLELQKHDPKMLEFCLEKMGYRSLISWIHGNTELRYNLPEGAL